ncbi:hypothetical protein BS17DRAFT_765119 [Gyrodon lividus]|nr:hypothetical protein BS17DRAFT_765119 [Gyrodon lividus]
MQTTTSAIPGPSQLEQKAKPSDFGDGDGTNNAHNQNEHHDHSNVDNQLVQHGGNGNPIANLDLDKMAHIATLPKHEHVCDLSFIHALRNATLDSGIGLTGDVLHCLCNLLWEALQPDPNTKLALSAATSQDMGEWAGVSVGTVHNYYKQVMVAILAHHDDVNLIW